MTREEAERTLDPLCLSCDAFCIACCGMKPFEHQCDNYIYDKNKEELLDLFLTHI